MYAARLDANTVVGRCAVCGGTQTHSGATITSDSCVCVTMRS